MGPFLDILKHFTKSLGYKGLFIKKRGLGLFEFFGQGPIPKSPVDLPGKSFKLLPSLIISEYHDPDTCIVSHPILNANLGTVWKYLKFFLFSLRRNISRPPPSPPLFSSSKTSSFQIPPPPPSLFSSSYSSGLIS